MGVHGDGSFLTLALLPLPRLPAGRTPQVDENMRRAHLPNAAATSRFHFRKFVAPICNPASPSGKSPPQADTWPSPSPCGGGGSAAASATSPTTTSGTNGTDDNTPPVPPSAAASELFEEMTMDEIFNGKDTYYPGLVPLVYAYLDYVRCDTTTFKRLDEYLQFIVKRARGELVTPATWMRSFVTGHPRYQRDSVVTPEIAHDLLVACDEIGTGVRPCPEVLGDATIKHVRGEDAYGHVRFPSCQTDQPSPSRSPLTTCPFFFLLVVLHRFWRAASTQRNARC